MDHHQRIVVTGIQIPFFDMVSFLVTLAIAAIPAMIIVSAFLAAAGVMLTMLVGGLGL